MNNSVDPALKKVLGFPSLFAAGIGLVVAQSCFVSILQGVGSGGASFFIALIIAFILTLCYSATFAELSLMMPKAGGLSTYTLTAIGPFPAIVATICGYIIPNILVSPAELFLLEQIFYNLFPGIIGYTGLLLVILFAVLNFLGIDIFSTVQNVLAYTMVVALVIVGIVGLSTPATTGITISSFIGELKNTDGNVFSLVLLALWAFLGLEFICPLIEETKNPARNIPKTFWAASAVLLILYSMISIVGLRQLTADKILSSNVPHWLLLESLFGKAGGILMAVLAITATSTSLNTVMAVVPRMLYGMAHHNQIPAVFMRVHPRFKTPWVGILFFSLSVIVIGGLIRGQQNFVVLLLISSATGWLITYIIAHVNVIVLRRKYPDYKRPYKSPFYPWPQLIGISGMVYALIKNAPTEEMTLRVYTIFLSFTGATVIYAFFWVRYRMKKGLFEAEPLENALED